MYHQQTRLETIYSVGEGRTVVIAIDGCKGCADVFEQFVKQKKLSDDRIIVLVEGPKKKQSQGRNPFQPPKKGNTGVSVSSGTSDGPKGAESSVQIEGLNPVPRKRCPLTNRVVVPNEPLTDFQMWDKKSLGLLTKVADRASHLKIRFEAIQILPAPHLFGFGEAVVEFCDSVDADLVVVGDHRFKSFLGHSSRSKTLHSYLIDHSSCSVLQLIRHSNNFFSGQLNDSGRNRRPGYSGPLSSFELSKLTRQLSGRVSPSGRLLHSRSLRLGLRNTT